MIVVGVPFRFSQTTRTSRFVGDWAKADAGLRARARTAKIGGKVFNFMGHTSSGIGFVLYYILIFDWLCVIKVFYTNSWG